MNCFFLSDENRYTLAAAKEESIEEAEMEIIQLQRRYNELIQDGKREKAELLLPRIAELEDYVESADEDDEDDDEDEYDDEDA